MFRTLVLVGTLACAVGAASAQTLPDDVSSMPWVVDGGTVDSAVQSGSVLYLGGSFDSVARRSDVVGPVAVFDAASAQLIAADPALTSAWVSAVVSDGAGGWFVGGIFSVNGRRRQLLRVDAAGRQTAWALDVGDGLSEIYALARAGTTLYLGGNFAALGGQPRTLTAAVDIPSETPLPWSPSITGNGVSAIVVDGNDVYLGGFFDAVGGVARNGVAVLHRTTAVLGSFAPNVAGVVSALAVSPPTVFVGGGAQHLAAFDRVTGSLAMGLPVPDGNEVFVGALVVSGATLYVGGGFASMGGVPRHGAAAIDITSGTLLPWAPVTSGSVVFGLAVSPRGVYLGGVLNGVRPRHALRVHSVTGVIDTTWDPRPGSLVLDFDIDGDRVATVGAFRTFRATRTHGLVGVDLATGQLVSMPTITPRIAWVYALAVRSTTLYAGGYFDTIGGQARTALAAVDLTTRQVMPFSPVITATGPPTVGALALSGSDLFVAGRFDAIGGVPKPALARLDAATATLAAAFTPPALTGISSRGFTAVTVANGRVWTAGEFTSAGATARQGFAVFDAASGALDPFDLQPSGPVDALGLLGDRLFVGGRFAALRGQPRAGLASVHTGTRTLESWTAQAFSGVGPMAVSDGIVFATGQSALRPRFGITALDAGTGAELPWYPAMAPSADVLLDTGAGLLATKYVTAEGQPQQFVRRAATTAPSALTDVGVLVQGTRVTVRWTPSAAGALPTGYTLRAGGRPGASDIGVVTMPRYAGVGLVVDVPPGTYFLRIVPDTNGVPGPASREFAFISGGTGCLTVPTPPALSATGAPPVLAWMPPAGTTPTGYELRAGVAPGMLDLVRLPLAPSTTAFPTAGAAPGTYYVAVAAVNACGVSELSNEVAVVVPMPGAPTAPTELTASASGTTVAVSWTPPAGAVTGYVLEAGTSPGLANLISGLALGPAPGLVAQNVPPGTYYLRVRAANGALVSTASNEIVVTVP